MVHLKDSGFGLISSANTGDFRAPGLDVQWEPSPWDVVTEMLRLGEVSADDMVFDLGCGDGRIVVEAALQRGARGVGIDLDPQRIRESTAGLERRGVHDLVSFRRENIFETDISAATVVTLFLFRDVNLRLRPKLLGELRPGTRVVSYCHNMAQWRPDRSVRIGTNYLHYWVIPDNASGTWTGDVGGCRGGGFCLELEQEFQRITGFVRIDEKGFVLEDGIMKGSAFSAVARDDRKDGDRPLFLDGRLRGDRIAGLMRGYDLSATGREWTADRNGWTKTGLAK